MAINTIGTSQVGDSIPVIVAAQALGYLKANTVMSRLVRRDWDDDLAQAGQSIYIPYGGTLTPHSKTAGTAITLNQADDAKYTVTLNQHYENSFLIEDIAKAFARPDWLETYTIQAIKALAEKIDDTLTDLYSSFSQTIDASAGLGEDDFRNARRYLNSAKAPLGERFAVLHEDADFEALGIDRIVNRDYAESLGNMAAESFVNKFAGFNIFLDQQIEVATTCQNMFFHRDAMVLACRPLALAMPGMGVVQTTADEDGIGLRVTMSYDHDYLGYKVTVDCLWGVAALRVNHGVVVTTAEI